MAHCPLPTLDISPAELLLLAAQFVFCPLCFANMRTLTGRKRNPFQLEQRGTVGGSREADSQASGREFISPFFFCMDMWNFLPTQATGL